MERLVLSDAAWERMAPLIIGRPDQKGSTGRDNRMFVEGVLWIVRTGSPWRDLPESFGDWNSVFRRFSRWSIKGVWWRIFEAMSDDPYSSGVGHLVELQVSGEDLALRLALRSVDAGRGSGRG